MILTFKDRHKADISLLFSQNAQVLQEFCKLSVEYLTKGPNLKQCQNAASKLGVDPDDILSVFQGLVNLLLECCKHKLSLLDFRDSMLTVGFSEEQQQVLSSFYEDNQLEILRVLETSSVDIPHYDNLDWRFEAQVGSRALLYQIEPQVTMKLSLKTRHSVQNVLLEADVNNVIHMAEKLEEALNEAKTQHFRRVQRKFK